MMLKKTVVHAKFSFLFKMVAAFLILGLMGVGSLYYIKTSIQKWCQQQNLDVDLKSWRFGLMGLTLKEIKVKNSEMK